jgi:benzil reductase ((S)-benzoin forming)
VNKIVIITGCTSGIGFYIVEKLCKEYNGIQVFGINRRKSTFIDLFPKEKYKEIICDLADIDSVINGLKILVKSIAESKNICYINNAASILPIRRVIDFENIDIISSININIISQTLILKELLQSFGKRSLKLINVTSGASNKNIEGWSLYSSSKAFQKSFFSNIEFENRDFENIEVLQIDPGIVDTGMQEEIRKANINSFPSLSEFTEFYNQGKLISPSDASQKIINLI